jgi:hypothetical protein
MAKYKKIDTIVDTYVDDYDITYLHSSIMSKLIGEKSSVGIQKQELRQLEAAMEKRLSFNTKKEIQGKMDILRGNIEDIVSHHKINTYESGAIPLTEQYKSIKSTLPINTRELHKVIDKFIQFAGKFISLNITKIYKYEENVCNECGCCLDNVKLNKENTIRCPICKTDHQVILNKKIAYDSAVQNCNADNDMENFMKTLLRYEGLQQSPPAIIYTKLDTYFQERGFPPASEIKLLPYNMDGRKGNTNREMLCNALSHIGYSDYYEDCNLIGHIYWDWKLPNLSNIKPLIIEHYKITQKCFYKIPLEVRNRISSLGTQYRLWRHLQLLNYECYMEDFKIAENSESLQNHHRLWKLICNLVQRDDIYYID